MKRGKVQKVVAAHDVGRAINPNGVEGQIEGGVAMGMGYALTEEFQVHNGAPAVTFGTLGLLRSTQTPEIECRIIEKNQSELAYGAKGVGEIVMHPDGAGDCLRLLAARRQAAHQPAARKTLHTAATATKKAHSNMLTTEREQKPQTLTERAASRAAD